MINPDTDQKVNQNLNVQVKWGSDKVKKCTLQQVMQMKEKILSALKNENKALEVMDVYNLLNFHTIDELNEVRDVLEEMQNAGEIFKTNKGKYILFENCPGVFVGKLDLNKKGFGFVVIPQEDDLYIPAENLNGAVNDDLVICEITSRGIKPEGRIIRILKRDLRNLVGEMIVSSKGKLVFGKAG